MGRGEPAHGDARAATWRDVTPRGDRFRPGLFGAVPGERIATERLVLRAVARGARDRLLVLAREALHHLYADVPRARDGGGSRRRVDCGRWRVGCGALAARPRDWSVGRRIRHSLRVPGS